MEVKKEDTSSLSKNSDNIVITDGFFKVAKSKLDELSKNEENIVALCDEIHTKIKNLIF